MPHDVETPDEPCRSDAESSITTLGELSFGDDRNVTLWTCSLTKKQSSYFLVWAALSSEVEANKRHVMGQLKSSQPVSNDLCAMNVINGGCHPSAARLVAAVTENVRK